MSQSIKEPEVITDLDHDVTEFNSGRTSYFWDGYNIVKFTQNGGAWASAKGSIHNGKYGYKEIISVNSEGKWILDK